jgi:hypothetical protein
VFGSIVSVPVEGLSDQVTAVLVVLVRVALNCCVCPAESLADAGLTVTEIGMVYIAVATALGAIPVLKATALIVSVLLNDSATVYGVDVWLCVLPTEV